MLDNKNFSPAFLVIEEPAHCMNMCIIEIFTSIYFCTDEPSRASLKRLCTEWLENWDVFDCAITGNECWIFEYDPETQWQSREWETSEEPRTKKARMSKSQTKSKIVTFFDYRGIILKHWVPHGQTITAVYYIEVHKRLRQAIVRKQPEL